MHRIRTACLATTARCALAWFGLAAESGAAVLYWDGSSGSSWSTTASWSTTSGGGSTPGAVPGTGDTSVFNATSVTNQITTIGTNRTVGALEFNSSASSAITLGTVNDFTLTLENGITMQSGTGAHTVNSAVSTSGTLVNNSSNNLTFGGTVTSSGTSSSGLTFGGSGSGTFIFNGTLNVGGFGYLMTNNLSTPVAIKNFTMSTTVSLHGAGGFSFLDGGTITNGGGSLFIYNNNTSIAADIILSNSTLQRNLGIFLSDGNSLTISGDILNGLSTTPSNISFSGPGTVTLTGNNTFTGSTSVTPGTLVIDSESRLGGNPASFAAGHLRLGNSSGGGGTLRTTATFSIDDSNRGITLGQGASVFHQTSGTTLTIANVMTHNLAFHGSLNKAGPGTLVLTADNTFVLPTFIEEGTLRLTGVGDISDVLTVTAGIFDVAGITNPTLTSLSMGGGASGTSSSITLASGRTLTLNTNVTYSATNNPLGATISGGTVDLGSSARTFTVGDSSAATADMAISSVISGTGGGITKADNGTLMLSGANTYTGATTINAGTLLVGANAPSGSAGALGNASSAVLVGDTTGSSNAALLTSGAFTVGRSMTLQSGNTGVITLGGNTAAASVFSGAITLGTASGTAKNVTLVALSGGSVDFQGVINENTSVPDSSVTIGSATHTGTVKLSGTNQYSGITTVTNGAVLEVTNLGTSGGSSVGNSARTTASNLVLDGGTLRYTGTGESTTRLFTIGTGGAALDASGSAALTLGTGSLVASGSGDRTFTLTGTNTGTNTLSASIPNPGTGTTSLTKTGAGTWRLSGNNPYTGLTMISQGTLEVAVNNALGTNAAGTTVNSGAALKLTSVSYATTEALTINGTGISSGGALVNSGTSSFAGQITVATSASIASSSGTLTLTGGLVKDGTTLTFTGGGIITVNTNGISGASVNSDLIVDGVTVNLNTANSYNGPTFIRNSGTLNANAANALPTANGRTAVTFDGTGTSVLNINDPQSVASLSSAGAATVSIGTFDSLTVGTASGTTTFAGSIGGNGSLIKDEDSTQVLSGSNGYTGATTIEGGTLRLSGSGSISSNLTVTAGTFDVAGTVDPTVLITMGGGAAGTTSAITLATGRTLNLSSNVTYSATNNPLGATISGGTLGLGATTRTFTIGDSTATAADMTVSSAISGTGGINKQGAGTLVLGSNNSYTGATSIVAGVVSIDAEDRLGGNPGAFNAAQLSVSSTGTLRTTATFTLDDSNRGVQSTLGTFHQDATTTFTIAKVISGNGLNKAGAGTLELTADNTFTGTTTINEGILRLTGVGDLPSGGSLVINAGTLDVAGSTDPSFTGVTMGGGASSTTSAITLASGRTLTLGGNVTYSATNNPLGATLSGGTLDLGASSRTFAVGNSTAAADDLTISSALSGTGGFVKTGLGKMVLNGSGSVSGGTLNVVDGTLELGGTVNLTANNSGFFTLGSAGATGTSVALTMGAGNTLNLIGGLTFSSSSTLLEGTVSGGTISLAAGTHAFASSNTTSANEFTISSPITGTGGVSMSSVAGAVITFSGPNTYTGATQLSSGVLSIDAEERLGGNPGTFAAGHLALSGGVLRTTASFTLDDSNRGVTIFGGTIETAAATTFTLANVMTGSGTLTKTGAGELEFTAANTLTGATIVSEGTLQVTGAGKVGTGALTVVSGLFDVAGAADQAVASLTMGGGGTGTSSSVTIASGRTLTLNGDVTYSATGNPLGVTISGGTLGMGSSSRTFTVGDSSAAAADMTITSVISGTSGAGFFKAGAGTLLMSGNNTFAGSTQVTTGLLILDYTTNTGSKLSDTALLVVGGTIRLEGHATTAVTEMVSGFNAWTNAAKVILDANGGAGVSLNLGSSFAVTGTGTVDFTPDTGSVFFTSAANTNGILGGYATYQKNGFATNASGQVAAFSSTVKDNVATWAANDNVTDSTGYTGTVADCLAINSLRFNASGSSTVTVGGHLMITSGAILMTETAAGAASITGGDIFAGANNLYVHQHNTGQSLTIASRLRISNLIKTGAGELILNSTNNTSTSIITIQEGTLTFAGGNAIRDTVSISMSDVVATTFKLTASGTVGSIFGGMSGSMVDLGSQTLTLNVTIGDPSYAGALSGIGTLVKTGTATQILTAASPSFTGAVVVTGGTLSLTGDGVAHLSGISSLTLKGSTLSTVLTGSAANHLNDNAPISMDSAVLTHGYSSGFGEGVTQHTENLGAVTLRSGSNSMLMPDPVSGTNPALVSFEPDNLTRLNGATLKTRGDSFGSGGQTPFKVDAANEAVFISANVVNSVVPWVVRLLSGSNSPVSMNYTAGNGFVDTSTYASYAVATATQNVNISSSLAGVAGKTINSLRMDTGGSLALSGTGAGQMLTVTSGAFIFGQASGATVSISGFDDGIRPGPTSGSVGNEFIFHEYTTGSGATTISSPLINSTEGSTRLIKSGPGRLVLNAVNTYSGATILNEGTLEINAWAAIGGDTGSAPLRFAGGILKLASGFTGSFNRSAAIEVFDGGGSFDTNGASITLNTPLASPSGHSGTFTKTGSGALTLGQTSTHTGGTTVSAGTLTMGANQAIGTGDLMVAFGATLDSQSFNATVGNVTVTALGASNGTLSGTGTLTTTGSWISLAGGAHTVLLAGTAGLLKVDSANTATLSNPGSTFTGQTILERGTLSVTKLADAGVASSLGAPTGADATIQFRSNNSTTLTYTGSGDITNRGIEITSSSSPTLNANGTGALVITGGIESTTVAASTLTLGGTSAEALINRISGDITQCFAALAVTKNDANTWALGGNSSFTGSVTINGGTLRLEHNNALGLAVTTTMQGTDTVLELANGIIAPLLNGLTISSTGNNKTLRLASGATSSTWNGTITISESTAGNFDVGADTGGTLTIHGIISGTGDAGLTKEGAGKVVLTANNSYTKQTTVNGGTLELTDVGDISNSTLTINAGLLNVVGTADQTITTLSMGGGSGTTASITLDAGRTLNLGGNVTFVATSNPNGASITGGTLAMGGSDRTFTVGDSSAATDDLTIGSTITGNSSSVDLIKAGPGKLVLTADNTWTGTTTIDDGTLELTGSLGDISNNALTITSGTLNIAGSVDQVITATTALTMGGGASGTTSSITMASGRTLTVNGNVTYSATNNPNGASISGGTVSLGGSTRTFTVNNSTAVSEDMTIGSTITGTGSAGITKAGSGRLVLTAANLYPGSTIVSAGVLRLAHNSALPAGTITTLTGSADTAVELADGIITSSTAALDVANTTNNKTLRLNSGATSGTWGGQITISDTTPGEFDVGADMGGHLTLTGLITGSGAAGLTKVGAGKVTLAVDNSYTGRTTVQEGTLAVASEERLGNNPATFQAAHLTLDGGTLEATASFDLNDSNRGITLGSAGGTVRANSGVTLTLSKLITGSGSFTKTGPGTVVLNASNNYSGSTFVSAGTLQVNTGFTTGTGPVTVQNGGTLAGTGTVQGAATVQSGGAVSPGDNGGAGIGTLNFSSGLTFESGSIAYFTINGPTTSDRLNVTGTLSLSTHTTVDQIQVTLSGYTPVKNDAWDLLDWTTMLVANSFDPGTNYRNSGDGGGDLDLPNLDPGLVWNVSDFLNTGTVQVVPEPGRALLLMFGLASLLLRRRRALRATA